MTVMATTLNSTAEPTDTTTRGAKPVTKVQGKPFKESEIIHAIEVALSEIA